MKLLRFLIIAIALLYIFRYLFKILLPVLFRSLIEKGYQQHYYTSDNRREKIHKEGETTIKYVPQKEANAPLHHTRNKNNDEEFVDFEEIK